MTGCWGRSAGIRPVAVKHAMSKNVHPDPQKQLNAIALPILSCHVQMHDKLMARRLLDISASEGDAPTWINVYWEGQSAHTCPGMPAFWQGCIPDRQASPSTDPGVKQSVEVVSRCGQPNSSNASHFQVTRRPHVCSTRPSFCFFLRALHQNDEGDLLGDHSPLRCFARICHVTSKQRNPNLLQDTPCRA